MSPIVSVFMSIWPQLALGMFIVVIILSYQIERRSAGLANRSRFPRWPMLFHTITNLNVARDSKTQSMRRIMLLLLAGIVALFILVAFAVGTIERPI